MKGVVKAEEYFYGKSLNRENSCERIEKIDLYIETTTKIKRRLYLRACDITTINE